MTLQEIITTLEPLVADFDPSYYYWITANPSLERENDIRLAGSSESGEHYCEQCADKEIDRMEAIDPDGEYIAEGGQYYGAELSDSFEFCSKCDRPLWVTLTTEGARSGLEGFKHWIGNLHADPQSCDEFIKICEAILQEDDGKERAKLEEEAMIVYPQMCQLMDLYQELSPTEGLNIWLTRDANENLYIKVETPYTLMDKPRKDEVFVDQIARIFKTDWQGWTYKR